MSKNITKSLIQYWLLLLLAVIIVLFGIMEPRFLSVTNLLNIVSSTCVVGIATLGITVVMSAGEIDFACGMELSTAAVAMVLLMDKAVFSSSVWGYALAILVTLGICLCIGAVNAFLNIKIGIPAFIATMGVSLVLEGYIKIITNSSTVRTTKAGAVFNWLGQGYIGFVPVSVVVLLIFTVIMWVYTELTSHGKKMYAVGANATACHYIGINPKMQKLKGFLISAVLCGVAGIMQGSMVNSASAGIGSDLLFSALTALMLGATVVKIGVFNVIGSLLSALLVSILSNGFTMVGMPPYMKDIVQGLILIGAVTAVLLIRVRMANKK